MVPELHSHLEPMSRIALDEVDDQISFSYIKYNGVANVISLPGPFSKDVDSTRYLFIAHAHARAQVALARYPHVVCSGGESGDLQGASLL